MLTLSESQLRQYHEQGYLLLTVEEHGLFKDPQVLPRWSEEVRTWPVEEAVGKWMPYYEDTDGGKQIMRTEKFMDYHNGFGELLRGDDLRGILGQLSGEEMLIFKDKINYKLPGGGGFAPHQDAPAYNHISKVEHVTANIAIHEATSKNGCLEVIPGSHKMQIDLVPGGGQITQEWCDTHTWLPVPLGVGDVLIFGSHLAHRSGPNRSTSPRAMLYATYAGARDGRDLREKYYAHRREAFPPDHERVEGKDYSKGWETYAFAAPFSKQGIKA